MYRPQFDVSPRSRPAREGADTPDDEEEEPSWDLPAELQEFQGDPTDRKGMLTFRQTQQAARKVRVSPTRRGGATCQLYTSLCASNTLCALDDMPRNERMSDRKL